METNAQQSTTTAQVIINLAAMAPQLQAGEPAPAVQPPAADTDEDQIVVLNEDQELEDFLGDAADAPQGIQQQQPHGGFTYTAAAAEEIQPALTEETEETPLNPRQQPDFLAAQHTAARQKGINLMKYNVPPAIIFGIIGFYFYAKGNESYATAGFLLSVVCALCFGVGAIHYTLNPPLQRQNGPNV